MRKVARWSKERHDLSSTAGNPQLPLEPGRARTGLVPQRTSESGKQE
jgi:hypothetical protein